MGCSTSQRIYQASMQSYSTMKMAIKKSRSTWRWIQLIDGFRILKNMEVGGDWTVWIESLFTAANTHPSQDLPTSLLQNSSKAVMRFVNIRNKDDLCFLYSILAHIHPTDPHPNRVNHYTPFLHKLDYSGLTIPLKLRQIRKFEDQNPQIFVNVLYHDQETYTIMPLRVTKYRNRQHHVNLFLLDDDGAKNKQCGTENPPTDTSNGTSVGETEAEPKPKYHYTLVRNLSTLVRQDTKSNGTQYVCPYCLHVFYENVKSYEIHLIDCKIHKPQVIKLPDPSDEKKNSVSFRNVFKSFPVQFCLYVDFECFLGESDGSRKNVQQIHEVSGSCMLRVLTKPTLNNCKPYLYSGENVMEEFYRHLQQEQEEIDFYLRTNLPMEPLTLEEQKQHDDAVECQQCHKPFENTRAMRKVRHHLHLTGKYAMTVCSSCNLQLKPRVRKMFREKYFFDDDDNESQFGNENFMNDWQEPFDSLQEDEFPGDFENGRAPEITKDHFFIPVIVHNVKGYDSHTSSTWQSNFQRRKFKSLQIIKKCTSFLTSVHSDLLILCNFLDVIWTRLSAIWVEMAHPNSISPGSSTVTMRKRWRFQLKRVSIHTNSLRIEQRWPKPACPQRKCSIAIWASPTSPMMTMNMREIWNKISRGAKVNSKFQKRKKNMLSTTET